MGISLTVIFKFNVIVFIVFALMSLQINYSTMKKEKGRLLHKHYRAKVFSGCLQIYALCFVYFLYG